MSRLPAAPMGEFAWLVECRDLATVHRLHRRLTTPALPRGVTDVVAGWRSVLVVADPEQVEAVEALVGSLADDPAPTDGGSVEPSELPALEVPVRYDGPDLAEVAQLTGLPADEVARRHAAGRYRVGIIGFSPGFGYLTGLDPALHVQRRETPRTRVPAGAVAIAGPHTAVYPQATPGGWRLIGRTEVSLFDVASSPPTPLWPGRAVRFLPA